MGLLIGFDDTPAGRDALALGLELAGETGEPTTVATVYPDDERGLMVAINDSAWVEKVRGVAEGKLDVAREIAGQRPDIQFQAVGPASASRGLHEYAEQTSADVLVVGSTERALLGRLSLGSTVERLLHGAPCSVAVAPRGYRTRVAGMSSIAVAYDGSPEAAEALDVAVRLAGRLSTPVRLVAVAARHDEAIRATLDDAVRGLADGVQATATVFTDSDVVDVLADLPDHRPDLLVCGSRGYGAVRQVLLGSVSSRLVRSAAYPVLVVPRPAQNGG